MKGLQIIERNLILDFVKGVLVIFMVIYHALNIFTSAGWEAYSYIRFVSGSFLFISGYIISIYYAQKFDLNKLSTSMRLAVRGIKLLSIFTLLNLTIQISGIGNPNKIQAGMHYFLNNGHDIFGLGKPGLASFQILLPIAYLMILSPLFLLLSNISIAMICLSLIAGFAVSYFEIESVNIGLGILGVIGLYGGLLANRWEITLSLKRKDFILAGLLTCFYLMRYLDRNLVSYAIGVAFVIKLIYDLGAILNLKTFVNRLTILLGQYSLITYIGQIVFLQCLSIFVFKIKWEISYQIVLLILCTNLFLVALCLLLSRIRVRYKGFDAMYRFVFS